MGGTRDGGLRAKEANKARYGEDFYPVLGAMGGKVKVAKGFAKMDPERLAEVSSKGGKRSKRRAKKEDKNG